MLYTPHNQLQDLLFYPAKESIGATVHHNRCACVHFASQQSFGNQRFRFCLQVPLQRACAINRVIAVFNDMFLRRLGNAQL